MVPSINGCTLSLKAETKLNLSRGMKPPVSIQKFKVQGFNVEVRSEFRILNFERLNPGTSRSRARLLLRDYFCVQPG